MANEDVMTLKDVASRFSPEGTTSGTVSRHVLKGVRTKTGVVRLDAWRIGGRWVTSREAVERFRDACTAGNGGTPRPEAGRRHARADAYLKSRGL